MRTLIIGLDGATFRIIEPLARQGELENISRLISGGYKTPMDSTIPPVTAPAWTTMITGFNPGQHGVYDFLQKKRNSYDYEPINSESVKRKTFFDILSREKRSICSINVPNTFPPKEINGVMVPGMLTPEISSECTWPPEFAQKLRRISYKIAPTTPHKKKREYKKDLFRCMEGRFKAFVAAKDYFGNFDLGMVVLSATDHVGHYFWDEKDPLNSKMIRETYKKADELVRKFMKESNAENVLLVSDHGMTRAKKSFFINNYLMREGFIELKKNAKTRLKQGLTRVGITKSNVYSLIECLNLTNTLKRGIMEKGRGKTRKSLIKKFFLSLEDINWNKTQAFAFGTLGQVFINLEGRETEGCVPRSKYEQVRDEVIQSLAQARDTGDGRPIIQDIYRRESIYSGKQLEKAPDIVFTTADYQYRLSRFFDFGSNKIVSDPVRKMNGNHEREGIFIANKPLKRGHDDQKVVIKDVAPTVLASFDLEDQKTDGKAIPLDYS